MNPFPYDQPFFPPIGLYPPQDVGLSVFFGLLAAVLLLLLVLVLFFRLPGRGPYTRDCRPLGPGPHRSSRSPVSGVRFSPRPPHF